MRRVAASATIVISASAAPSANVARAPAASHRAPAMPLAASIAAPLASQIELMSAGQDNTCAFNESGLAYCWGDNDQLALGNGTSASTDARVPTQHICLP